MPQPGAPAQPAPPAGGATPPGAPVDPMVVRRIMVAVTKILHDPSTSPKIVAMMKAAGDPVQAVLTVMVTIGKEMLSLSKGTITKPMMQAVTPQMIEAVMELGQAAGILQASPQLAQQVQQAIMQKAQQAQQQAPGAPPTQPAPPPGV